MRALCVGACNNKRFKESEIAEGIQTRCPGPRDHVHHLESRLQVGAGKTLALAVENGCFCATAHDRAARATAARKRAFRSVKPN